MADTVSSVVLFLMPSLGADMEVGTVLDWRIAPGDEVHPGDIVALVDTEKAEIEVEIFDGGIVDRLVVPVGEQVPVGALLAELRPLGAAVPAGRQVSSPLVAAAASLPEPAVVAAVAKPEPVPVAVTERTAPVHPQPHVVSPLVRHLAETRHLDIDHLRGSGVGGRILRADVERVGGRHRASPRARRLAAERGIELANLTGSGPDGAVVGDDVLAAPRTPRPAGPPEPTGTETQGPVTVVPAAAAEPEPDRMRQAIAALMSRSWREIPHYHLSTRVDLSTTMRWVAATNEGRPIAERILPAAVLLRATAIAAGRHPSVNGWWKDDRFRPATAVDLGVVVALRGGGLVAPTIAGADQLSVDEIMVRLREIVARARKGRLRSSDTATASITVTNLGDLGVDQVAGVIHPPQVALVGLGSIHDEPWAEAGMLGVRPVVHASLAGDHRASDGLAGAAFLSTLTRVLQQPESL